MADPLSVAASIAGLLTLAGKVTTIIVDVTSKSKAAPKDMQYVQTSVETIRTVLLQLQMLLLGRAKVERQRTSLILVEQVVITLSACVSTFSELDVFVDSLNTDQSLGLLDRIRWATKASTVKELLDRLEAHKTSLTLMATILTCDNTYQAEDAVDQLTEMIQQVLNNHQLLAQRLLSIEIGMNVDRPLTTKPGNNVNRVSVDSSQPHRTEMGFAFQEILDASWVYKRAESHREATNFSVISAAGRTASWSMLSGLSLSDISLIAVLALPVYEHDISNSDAYKFGEYEEKKVPSGSRGPAANATDEEKRSGFSRGLSRIAAGVNPLARNRRRSINPNTPLVITKSLPAATKTITTVVDNVSADADALSARLDVQPGVKLFRAVFGVALVESTPFASVAISCVDKHDKLYVYGYVPTVIAKTCATLKKRGTAEENIFHKSGSPVRIQQLRELFESPPRYGEDFDWEEYSVHDAAGVMLRYLKALPEPVIPFSFYNRVRSAAEWVTDDTTRVNVGTDNATIVLLQDLVRELPPLNRQLLLYLLDFLAVFTHNSDQNLMTVPRLVCCLQPSLLTKPHDEMTAEDYDEAAHVIGFMINNQEHFLFETQWMSEIANEGNQGVIQTEVLAS